MGQQKRMPSASRVRKYRPLITLVHFGPWAIPLVSQTETVGSYRWLNELLGLLILFLPSKGATLSSLSLILILNKVREGDHPGSFCLNEDADYVDF
jgi:hypothetical protein